MLLTSVLGHGERGAVSRRLATSLTGFPAEILQAKLPAETTEQSHQMLLGLCGALAREALRHPRATPQQALSSHNRPLLHPNLPMGFGANLYSDVR